MIADLMVYVLISVSHVNDGANIVMREFDDRASCEFAASAIREMAKDAAASGNTRTWCVPKRSK